MTKKPKPEKWGREKSGVVSWEARRKKQPTACQVAKNEGTDGSAEGDDHANH
jgi:hypothetical protein